MPTNDLVAPSRELLSAQARAQGGLTIRAREPSDWQDIAVLLQLPHWSRASPSTSPLESGPATLQTGWL